MTHVSVSIACVQMRSVIVRLVFVLALVDSGQSFEDALAVADPLLNEELELEEDTAKCDLEIPAAIESQVSRRIHGAATLAALADGGLAQIPGAGSIVVPTIQAAMIYSIGRLYGCYMDRASSLMLVSWFMSNHVKKAVLKELIGWIPAVGNLLKTSVTFMLTEGIGNVAARSLRCGSSEALLVEASGGSVDGAAHPAQEGVFHLVSDYLTGNELGVLDSKDVWQRVTQLFETRGQEELLEEVRRQVHSNEALFGMVKKHAWNMDVVGAALAELENKFPGHDGCIAANFVANRFWASGSADAEIRNIAASHIRHCSADLSIDMWDTIGRSSAKLIVAARSGSRSGVPETVLRDSIDLLQRAIEDPMIDEQLRVNISSPWLVEDIKMVLASAMLALTNGQEGACSLMRSLLKVETTNNFDIAQKGSWVTVRRLQAFDKSEVPAGAEICVPALRNDMLTVLTLNSLPDLAELPQAEPGRTGSSIPNSPLQLENRLASALVGQSCALSRLIDNPGFIRFKIRGHWRKDVPLVLLLTGPSGTGKTLLARTLAEVLLGRPVLELEGMGRFRTFHMNQFSILEDQKTFFGPPRGVKGGTGDLPEVLRMWPDAVILLDEIEKAHHSFARAFLKIFGEHGAAYDPLTGKDIPTGRATFILTSNLGKDLISDRFRAAMSTTGLAGKGEGETDEIDEDADDACVFYDRLRDDLLSSLGSPRIGEHENFFKESEIRGRLTDVLPFLPFGRPEVDAAVRKFLTEESRNLGDLAGFGPVQLAWEPSVVQHFAAEYLRRPAEGLRGVSKHVHAAVTQAAGSALDAGLLKPHGGLFLLVDGRGSARLEVRGIQPGTFLGSVSPIDSTQMNAGESPDATSHFGLGNWWPWSSHDSSSGSSAGTSSQESFTTSSDSSFGMNWELLTDWDMFWQQMWEFLYEWRVPLAVFFTVALASTATATWLPAFGVSAPVASVAGSVATAASSASAGAAAVGSAAPTFVGAAAWLPGIAHALGQLALGAGSIAVPGLAAAYAWQHRETIVAVFWLSLALIMVPRFARLTYQSIAFLDAAGRAATSPRNASCASDTANTSCPNLRQQFRSRSGSVLPPPRTRGRRRARSAEPRELPRSSVSDDPR